MECRYRRQACKCFSHSNEVHPRPYMPLCNMTSRCLCLKLPSWTVNTKYIYLIIKTGKLTVCVEPYVSTCYLSAATVRTDLSENMKKLIEKACVKLWSHQCSLYNNQAFHGAGIKLWLIWFQAALYSHQPGIYFPGDMFQRLVSKRCLLQNLTFWIYTNHFLFPLRAQAYFSS